MALGSGLNGLVLMLAFARGSAPALLRRTVPLVAAIVIVARALMAPETQGAQCG